MPKAWQPVAVVREAHPRSALNGESTPKVVAAFLNRSSCDHLRGHILAPIRSGDVAALNTGNRLERLRRVED